MLSQKFLQQAAEQFLVNTAPRKLRNIIGIYNFFSNMSMNYQFNQLVRLKGLNNASYNGKLGRIFSFSAGELCCNGRYCVQLIGWVAPPLLRELSVKPENVEHACTRCHKGGEKLLFCGKCKNATYCTRECQRIDWERHKEECDNCVISRDASKYPLIAAITVGDLERVRKLVQEGIDVNKTSNTTNVSPLHTAAATGNLPIVQYLLQQGANKDKATNDGVTPLYTAAQHGHLVVLKYLVEQGADKEKPANDGITPLMIAALKGHTAVVRYLLEQGCDVNLVRTDNGFSALGMAAQNNHIDVVRCLVEQGADKETADNVGFTPLMNAILNGHLTVVRYLLAQGANKEVTDNVGQTPLMTAAFHGHTDYQ